jgi:RNA polymerase sigma-70 factor (ECF subfamily)
MDDWMDRRLREALKKLPPEYRMIVVMRETEGLSTREVAAVTGYSEANVKTRLHRARVMLRKHMESR